jgi:hypothetical protein
MATLNDFIASISNEGLMKTSRFSVMFTIPNAVADGPYTSELRKILLYCDTINLPGISMATTEAKTFGEIREMPYQKLFEAAQMTFYVDNAMSVKLLFDNWFAGIQDPVTRTFSYYDDYKTDMSIEVFDTADNSRYTLNMFQCYPKSIGAVQMDYQSKDIMKLTVTMNYKYWTSTSSQGVGEGDIAAIPNQYFTNFSTFQNGINQGSLPPTPSRQSITTTVGSADF